MALFPPGKGGGEGVDYGYKGKGVTIHSLVDADGAPLAIDVGPANLDERIFVEVLLEQISFLRYPDCLYADKGYDARWLRNILEQEMGIIACISRRNWPKGFVETIVSNYRWVVERTFSWFQRKFRRFNVRWERKSTAWMGLINAAFIAF